MDLRCTNVALTVWGHAWIGWAPSSLGPTTGAMTAVPVAGVVHRTSFARAVFTADKGGAFTFRKMGPREFYDAACGIA